MSENSTTNVKGYFNPNSWPIFIEVSECNLKLELKPQEFIRDRKGNPINDPIFDNYVRPKGLSKEQSKVKVPINYVPRVVLGENKNAHSVSSATRFEKDGISGRMVPVYEQQAAPVAAPSVSRIPHQGMSMDEARKRGFVGKPLIVPEDYGVPDKAGAPVNPSQIPRIKYSMESNRRPVGQLPQEMLQEVQSGNASLVHSLEQSAKNSTLESENAAAIVRPVVQRMSSQLVGAQGAPVQSKPAPEPAPRTRQQKSVKAAPVKTTKPAVKAVAAPVRRVATPVQEATPPPEPQPLPEPNLEPASLPEPNLEMQAPTIVQGRKFVCLADGKAFRFRSELERHVNATFPANATQLLAPYPEAAGKKKKK